MNTQSKASRMADKEVDNFGGLGNKVPSQENQVPPLQELSMFDQALDDPQPINDRDIREDFLTLTQVMTYQDNTVISQFRAMMDQMNKDVGLHDPQHAKTMASCFRDFTRMIQPIFFVSNKDQDKKLLLN